MSEALRAFIVKVRLLLEKAVEASSFEYFDDDDNGNESYWGSFAY